MMPRRQLYDTKAATACMMSRSQLMLRWQLQDSKLAIDAKVAAAAA
jgi:hypothetical protein